MKEAKELPKPGSSHDIYLEVGQKKVFAVAVHWPGWCRSGRDEPSAIQAILQAAARYSKILGESGLEYAVAETTSDLKIVARLEGNPTTDFGAPDRQLPDDWDRMEPSELQRLNRILEACWTKFDRAAEQASGKDLRKGPRGGGRDLMKIIDHVVGAEEGYLRSLGWKIEQGGEVDIYQRRDGIRSEVLRGLEVAADGQLPREGSRGGKRWPARFFVRRLAWHTVDHAWEIEDRVS